MDRASKKTEFVQRVNFPAEKIYRSSPFEPTLERPMMNRTAALLLLGM
ncbi:hypothetical protein MALU111345_02970 [Marinicrinis lubricantis]